MRLSKWANRIFCALLAACISLSLSVPAWATDNKGAVEYLSINESTLTSSADTQSVSALQANGSNIQLSMTITQDNNCVASGTIPYNGTRTSFMASGNYYTAQNTNGKTILANLIGTADSEPMVLLISYDYQTERSYVYTSVGALDETNSPIQLEFGTFTDNIYQVNEEYISIKDISQNSGLMNAPVTRTSSNASDVGAIHQRTTYIRLPNGKNGAALSLYFPASVLRSGNFKFYSKLNTSNSALLAYIKASYDSSATGPIRVFNADITMRSRDAEMLLVKSNPPSSSSTVSVYVPYFFGTNLADIGSYNLATIRLPVTSITQTIGTTNGYDTSSVHKFRFGALGGVSSTDWDSSGSPNQAPSGVGVYNLMTYVGSSSSVSLIGETTVSIGYVGEGPRSGSRIVKAFSLGSTMAAGTITIR